MSSKLGKYISCISDMDPQITMQKRMMFHHYHTKRVEFLKELNLQRADAPKRSLLKGFKMGKGLKKQIKKGVKRHSKAYSDAVIAYDKNYAGTRLF